MSTYGNLVAEKTDQYLAAMHAVQQNFLKSFATFTASMPASPPSLAVAGLPTIQEVTDAGFSFAQKLLNQQQTFAKKLVAITASEAPVAATVAFGKAVRPKSKSAN